jgi:hypothetical protein
MAKRIIMAKRMSFNGELGCSDDNPQIFNPPLGTIVEIWHKFGGCSFGICSVSKSDMRILKTLPLVSEWN